MLIFFSHRTSAQSFSQFYLSEVWDKEGGSMPVFYRNASTTDAQNNVYVVGSTTNVLTSNDILVQKFSPEGELLWEHSFDGGANLQDMGTGVFVDDSNNVYITGAATQNSQNNLDLVVLKYNSIGSLLWTYYYNFGGSPIPHDAGTSITGDNDGGIYVTGTSSGNGTMMDYSTLKLKDNGTLLWSNRYDYTQYNEVPNKISFAGGQVFVTGASQMSLAPNKWELATVFYNSNNGNINGVKRSGGSSIEGVNEANDLILDDQGNIFVLGATKNQATGFDMSLYKLNNDLDIVWEQHFDGYGNDDKGSGLKMDSLGNIYAVGSVSNPTQGKNYSILKYDSTGVLQWSREFNGLANLDDEAVQLVVREDRIFVTGAARNDTNSEIVTMGYTADGDIFSVKTFDSPFGLGDKPTAMGIDLDNNLIIVGQIKETDTTFRNVTFKYNVMEKPIVPVYVDSVPAYNARELIVRFDKTAMNFDAVDKKNFDAGLLKDFVHEHVIDSLNAKFPFDAGRLQTFKIFHRMTTADSLSITRLGDTIPVPAFWATLSVMMPEDLDLFEAIDTLNTMKPMVHYGEVNGFIHASSVPNDPLYATLNLQHGLQSTVYPNAHVNMEEAWDIETGSSEIIVGVFDSPIYWAHPDFHVDSNYPNGSYEGSKIVDGWDYVTGTGVPINQILSPWDSHGTSVAGIIGAIRGNSEGIAGVAGGDFSVSNPNVTNSGVQLISFGILSEPPFTNPPPPGNLLIQGLTTSAINAIIHGAVLSVSGNYGLGVHIQNHSWQTTSNILEVISNNNQISNPLALKDAIHHAWKNNSIVVAARGNMNSSGGSASINPAYPSCYNDVEVLNVGASGVNGQRKTISNGDFSFGEWSSMYGSGMDFLAPGVTELIAAPYVQNNNPFPWINLPLQDAFPAGYTAFNGTSAAAPIVSGVAALMLSKHNTNNAAPNNLATEDIEHILQKTSYVSQQFILDSPNEHPSLAYTESEGFGLINAGLALQQVDYPNYFVRHFSNVSGAKSVSAPFQTSLSISQNNKFGIAPGSYVVNRYLVTWAFDLDLENNEEIIDFWPLLVKSFAGFKNPVNTIISKDQLGFQILIQEINGNSIIFTVESYMYELLYLTSTPWNNLNSFVPNYDGGINQVDFSFSLHIFKNDFLNLNSFENNDYVIFPNPINSSFSVRLRQGEIKKIEIWDTFGRKIIEYEKFNNSESYIRNLDIESVQSGVYVIKFIHGDGSVVSKKVIKS